tara:strand:- start:396 stop:698 length:303 start_codon:yes stop_codon:yes gene_type:complete
MIEKNGDRVMVDENESKQSTKDIKSFSRKKTTVVTGLIVLSLSLTAAGFFAYQNGLFSNLFNENSMKNITMENDKSIVEETQKENKASVEVEKEHLESKK